MPYNYHFGPGSGSGVQPTGGSFVDNSFPRFSGTSGTVIKAGQTVEDSSGNVDFIGFITGAVFKNSYDTGTSKTLVRNTSHIYTTTTNTMTYALPAGFVGDMVIITVRAADSTFRVDTTSGVNIIYNGTTVNGSATDNVWKVIGSLGSFTIDTTAAPGSLGRITSASPNAVLILRCEASTL